MAMIFVTGGTGLLGTHLLYDLTRSGQKVRALKRPGSSPESLKKVFSWYTSDPGPLLRNIEWVEADLLDIYSLTDVLDGITHVYHCAAMVSFERKHESQMMQINVEGTANMVNAALEKGIHKFMHVSSIAALGRTEHGEYVTEETFWKSSPENSLYSISKYGAEREVWRASEEGLSMVIVNPSLIIGPGNWSQSTCNMFSKGYKGIRYYTGGVNGFIDVRDVSALMIRLMNSDISSERFLLNGENYPFRFFFDLMHEHFGKEKPSLSAGPFLGNIAWRMEKLRSVITGAPPLITPETARSAHRVIRFSNEKIRKAFPEHSFIPLETSVKDTCEKFLKDRTVH